MAVKYSVDPNRDFQKAVKEAIEKTGDLTAPFILIGKRWFQANKAIFTLKGKGKYTDLSAAYKKTKQKRVGFVYPILRLNGFLERSITDPADKASINLIINKKTLILGSKIPYASAHQFGTKNMPARPPLLIGVANSDPTASEANAKEIAIWKNILSIHVLNHASKFGKGQL